MEFRPIELLGEDCLLPSQHFVIDLIISDQCNADTRLSGDRIFIHPAPDFFQGQILQDLSLIDDQYIVRTSQTLPD